MLNWILRYEPVIRLLDEMDATSVLDVGSGWSGLSWYWPHRVVQTDLNFAGSPPPPRSREGEAGTVRSTAERLPFADDAFDFAVALDMMEHLPDKHRWAVSEAGSEPLADPDGAIGIESVREGTVPGTHTVRYDSVVDRIEISHVAHSRDGFALGAVVAAEWLVSREGVFGMDDLLGGDGR